MERVRKNEKSRGKNKNGSQKRAELKFCTCQYLYFSELLGLVLGRKLYLPPLE